MNTVTKECRACQKRLPLEEFWRDNKTKDGLQYKCKKCTVLYKRARRENDPVAREKHRLTGRKWRKAHSERAREYRAETAAKRIEVQRISRAANPEQFRAQVTIDNLVRRGKIPRARDLQCEHCGKQAAHYHHYLGYAREHWRCVIPLCASCHNFAHSKYRASTANG